jgi:hypothetical protein
MQYYKSDKYTENYINSCNILNLCFYNKLEENIITIIKIYLLEYATGFAIFNKSFMINNKEYNFKNRIGHAIDYIPKLLSKIPILMYSINDFSNIIKNINHIPNINIVDLNNLYSILFKKKCIKNNILYFSNFHELLCQINHHICKLNLSNIIIKLYKKNDNNLIKYDEYIQNKLTIYIKYINDNNIEDIIINNCNNYKVAKIYNYNNINSEKKYSKTLLSHTDDILLIELSRIIYNNTVSTYNNNITINKIITLPPFVFINNIYFHTYELNALLLNNNNNVLLNNNNNVLLNNNNNVLLNNNNNNVLLNNNNNNVLLNNNNVYSLIIKEDNNKFYYYYKDDIYELNNEEFNELTSNNCVYLFYKKK